MQNERPKVEQEKPKMEMDGEHDHSSSIVHEGVIDVESIDKNEDGKLWQCPMDWNVISDEWQSREGNNWSNVDQSKNKSNYERNKQDLNRQQTSRDRGNQRTQSYNQQRSGGYNRGGGRRR